MGKLTDILHKGEGEELCQAWNETEAAKEFAPLPSGEYVARIIDGKLTTSLSNDTPGYKLTFEVLEGEHAGRRFWHDIWLTKAAMSMAKRDLLKIGVTGLEKLEQPLPPGIRCSVNLTLCTNDDKTQYNHVRYFKVLGIDEPERDPFAPADGGADAVAKETKGEAEDVADEPGPDTGESHVPF